jgi:hypothetical protein
MIDLRPVPTTGTMPPAPPPCTERPLAFDALDQASASYCAAVCAGCPARELCLTIGVTERASGTFGGQLLRDGRTVTR